MKRYKEFSDSLGNETKEASQKFYDEFFGQYEGTEKIMCTSDCASDIEHVVAHEVLENGWNN